MELSGSCFQSRQLISDLLVFDSEIRVQFRNGDP